VLRFLADNSRLALGKVVIAYVLRGLTIAPRTGELGAKGTVKSSWIAETFDLSPRAVRYAQESLRRLDWIGKDTGSTQRKLNRDGAYFVINLNCRFQSAANPKEKTMNQPPPTTTTPPLAASIPSVTAQPVNDADPLVIRHKACQPFAPLPAQNCRPFAPPIEDKETSYRRIKHQETHSAEAAGVCTSQGKSIPPRLERILREDLGRMSRLEALFSQATQRGWLVPSEANALNFLAAAARATLVGYDPPRLFATLVRRELWSHITQAQEDMARSSLMRYRETHPDAFRVVERLEISERDGRFRVGARQGSEPWPGCDDGQPGTSRQYSTLNVGESSGR
jgi:hypothetical protein